MVDSEIMNRELVPVECRWDLSSLYSSAEEWEKDFKKLDVLLAEYQSFRGRLSESAEILRQAFKAGDELSMV